MLDLEVESGVADAQGRPSRLEQIFVSSGYTQVYVSLLCFTLFKY